jgi:positive regulator of sigma E activity
MRLVWNLAVNLMLTLTGLSLVIGLVLGHGVMDVVLRSTVVLVISGLLVMLLAIWNIKGFRRAQAKADEAQPETSQSESSRTKTKAAA